VNAPTPPPGEQRVRILSIGVPPALIIGLVVVVFLNVIATACVSTALLLHLWSVRP
jgi:hypothetical protein